MSDIEREEFNQWILDSEYALASPATRRWLFDAFQAGRASGQDAEPVPGELRESVQEAVCEALGEALDCTRVWSAWSVGTMSQNDFQVIAEDPERVAEIADAAIAAITQPLAAPVSDEEINNRLICATRQFRHNDDNSPNIHKPRDGFVIAYDMEQVKGLIADIRTRPPAANQGVPDGWLHEVKAERKRQDEKWGGPEHDDQHRPDFFVQLIQDYAGWSRVMAGMGSFEKFRRRMIQVAALAGAAVEATDRALERASTPPQPMEDES